MFGQLQQGWAGLPEDVLGAVLKALGQQVEIPAVDGFWSVQELRLVCKQWRVMHDSRASRLLVEASAAQDQVEEQEKELTRTQFARHVHAGLAKNLTTLNVAHSQVIGHALLKQIGQLTGLTSLSLGDSCTADMGFAYHKSRQVTDEGLIALTSLVKLKRLDLSGCADIRGEALNTLGSYLTALTDLNLSMCWGLEYLKSGSSGPMENNLRPSWCLPGSPWSSSLRCLSLNMFKSMPTQQDVWSLGDSGLSALASLTGLRILDVSGSSQVTYNGLTHLTALQDLQELGLDGCRFLSEEALKAVCLKCPQLSTLRWSHAGYSPAAPLLTLAHARSLTSLDIGRNTAVSTQGLWALVLVQNRLTTLSLKDCGVLAGDGAMSAVGTIRSLTRLDLEGCDITDDGLDHLHNLNGITSLTLDHCHKVTSRGVASLASHTPGLSFLSLERCYLVCDLLVMFLARYTPMLHTLNLARCTLVTDQGIAMLVPEGENQKFDIVEGLIPRPRDESLLEEDDDDGETISSGDDEEEEEEEVYEIPTEKPNMKPEEVETQHEKQTETLVEEKEGEELKIAQAESAPGLEQLEAQNMRFDLTEEGRHIDATSDPTKQEGSLLEMSRTSLDRGKRPLVPGIDSQELQGRAEDIEQPNEYVHVSAEDDEISQSQTTASQNVAPQNVESQNLASQNLASQNMTSQNMTSQNFVSQQISSRNFASMEKCDFAKSGDGIASSSSSRKRKEPTSPSQGLDLGDCSTDPSHSDFARSLRQRTSLAANKKPDFGKNGNIDISPIGRLGANKEQRDDVDIEVGANEEQASFVSGEIDVSSSLMSPSSSSKVVSSDNASTNPSENNSQVQPEECTPSQVEVVGGGAGENANENDEENEEVWNAQIAHLQQQRALFAQQEQRQQHQQQEEVIADFGLEGAEIEERDDEEEEEEEEEDEEDFHEHPTSSCLTSLRVLRLTACRELTDRSLCALSRLPSLTALDVQACPKLTFHGIRALSSLPGLCVLNTKRCEGLPVCAGDQSPVMKCCSEDGRIFPDQKNASGEVKSQIRKMLSKTHPRGLMLFFDRI